MKAGGSTGERTSPALSPRDRIEHAFRGAYTARAAGECAARLQELEIINGLLGEQPAAGESLIEPETHRLLEQRYRSEQSLTCRSPSAGEPSEVERPVHPLSPEAGLPLPPDPRHRDTCQDERACSDDAGDHRSPGEQPPVYPLPGVPYAPPPGLGPPLPP